MMVSKRTDVCMFCKCKTVKPSLDTFLANYRGCILIVKNVPCEECEQCGAKYYPDSVMEKLEKITNEAKSRMQELSVADYSKVACDLISLRLLSDTIVELPEEDSIVMLAD